MKRNLPVPFFSMRMTYLSGAIPATPAMRHMKNILQKNIFLAFGFLFLFNSLFALPKKKFSDFHSARPTSTHPYSSYYRDENSTEPGGWVCTPSIIFSYVNYLPQPGNLSIKFPYKLTDNSNVVTTQQFSSSNDNLIGTGKWVYPSVGLEVGKENFTIEAQMGWYIHYWSDNLYGGINYRFILRKAHRQTNQWTLAGVTLPGKQMMKGVSEFPVKISVGFFYYQPIWTLGTIDIGAKQFDALGYTMNSLDSISGTSGLLTVYYHQNVLAFKPTFSIGFKPANNRLELQFAVSPLIMMSEVGGLRFYLNNGGAVEWVPRDGIALESVIPLNSLGLNATYNGEQLSSTPFRLRGIMYTFKIGVRIGN